MKHKFNKYSKSTVDSVLIINLPISFGLENITKMVGHLELVRELMVLNLMIHSFYFFIEHFGCADIMRST